MTDLFIQPQVPSVSPLLQAQPMQPDGSSGNLFDDTARYFAAGGLGNLLPDGLLSANLQPIATNAPAYRQSMLNKYAEMRDFINQLPPEIRNSLIAYDADRVARGSAPMTRQETVSVSQAAMARRLPMEGRQVSPWDVPGNFLSDLRGVVGSIPRLLNPETWLSELRALPTIPQHVSQAMGRGQNIVEAVATAPGVRMLPGSFIAANVSHPMDLLRHPLFTAMDVVPVLSEAAKATPVFAAAQDAARVADANATAAAARGDMALAAKEAAAAQPPSPLRTVALKALSPEGELVPSRFGQWMNEAAESPVGRLVKQVTGYRDVWGEVSRLEQRMVAVRDGRIKPETPFEQLVRDSQLLAEESGQTRAERIAFADKLKAGKLSDFTDEELVLRSKYRDLTERYAREASAATGDLGNIDGEWFPKEQYDAITRARSRAESTARTAALRKEILSPSGSLTADDIVRSASDALLPLDAKHRAQEVQAVMRAADGYGYDMTRARAAMNMATRRKDGVFNAVVSEIQASVRATPNPVVRLSVEEMRAALKPYRLNRQAANLDLALRTNNPKLITDTLSNLSKQAHSRIPLVDDPQFISSLKSWRDRVRWETNGGKAFTEKKVLRTQGTADRLFAQFAPARFHPMILNETMRRAQGELVLGHGATPEQVAAITEHILDGNWMAADRVMGWSPKDTERMFLDIRDDVTKTWQDMKAAGLDPLFVHQTTRVRGSNVVSPRLAPIPNAISQIAERSLDYTPYVTDWAVALTHQGMEFLTKQATEQLIQHVIQRYGIPQYELQDRFAPFIDRTGEASLTRQQQIRDIAGARYKRFNPDTARGSWGGVALDPYRQESWFIPAPLHDALHRLNAPKGAFTSIMDPVSKLFRVSVVGLSPRTQLYNILGGAVMLLGQGGRDAFKFWGEARRLMRDPSLIENETVRATLGSMEREFLDSDLGRAHAVTSYMFGRTARRMLDQAMESGVVQRTRSFLNTAAEGSFHLNGYFDDLYRTMAYLVGREKGAAAGLGHVAAEAAGEEMMRKVMMDWASLSPIERDVLKSVFPFYGFMRHALGYVMKYPIDHPLRASVLSAFGRAEVDDLGGLPLSFLAMVPVPFMGKDKRGGRMMLQLGAVNPFGDVANMMTVAGFIGATNPVISTLFDSVGLTNSGKADLYPSLRFNPDTARLDMVQANPLMSFATNTVPQSEILFTMFGLNRQFNDRARHDPAGAMRQLVSASGLPPMPRTVDFNQEYFKAELNRLRDVQTVRADALKSGNWNEALGYPSLQALYSQIQHADPRLLSAYGPQDKSMLEQQVMMALAGQSAGVSPLGSSVGMSGM